MMAFTTARLQAARTIFSRCLQAAIVLFVIGCGGKSATSPGFSEGGVRVLFIGNSLTYTNDLAGMLVNVAKAAGDSSVKAAAVAFPDFSLEDHLAEGTALRALRNGRWEFVVMQQGPSSLPENQTLLANTSRQFEPFIRAAGAEPVLFMVWPSQLRFGDFPAVLVSYRQAAHAVNGLFAPAGDAWTAAFEMDEEIALYGNDGFHPGVAGTYLAAIVLLHQLRGTAIASLPLRIPGYPASEAMVSTLHRAAGVAISRNPLRP